MNQRNEWLRTIAYLDNLLKVSWNCMYVWGGGGVGGLLGVGMVSEVCTGINYLK